MAKIKSPLQMADGEKVRTLEELKEHFDIVSILTYFDNGKLHEWLENYYYDKEADEIGRLDPSSVDIKEKICDILGVSCSAAETENISLEVVSDKNRRLDKLRKYTSADELLTEVDHVAFTQEELQRLLDIGEKKIYLCQDQEKFTIPETEGVAYIGVNHPLVNAPEWYDKKGITLQNVDMGIEEILSSAEKCAEDQNYAEAVKLWSKAASFGYAQAQFHLGNCYYYGEGIEEDDIEACKWYRKAAEQGDADAQYNLGNCYYNGEGVEEDYVEACKWYRKAAEQGDADAQYNLGDRYYFGEGVEEDDIEAYKWYRKAAEQGHANAQYDLGNCYYNGVGVEQDYVEACKWYRKAAEQGHFRAQFMVGICHLVGIGAEQNGNEAYEWLRKAADQGDEEAQYMVGECYEWGIGVEQDDVKAIQWYGKAQEQGINGEEDIPALGVFLDKLTDTFSNIGDDFENITKQIDDTLALLDEWKNQ